MNRPTLIGLSDALRALAALAPDDPATRRAILELVGVRAYFQEATSPESSADDEALADPGSAQRSQLFIPVRSPARSPNHPARPRRHSRAMQLQPLEPASVQSGLGDLIEGVEPLGEPRDPVHADPDSIPTLFEPLWHRAALLALVCVDAPGRELDFDRLVRNASRLKPLTDAPRKVTRQPARRVRILLDMCADMIPYDLDQRRLARDFKRLLGESSVSTLFFKNDPWAGVRDPSRGRTTDFALPPQGTSVVVVTWLTESGSRQDVGATAHWARFALVLAKQGSVVVLLSPNSERALASHRTRHLAIVAWDRSTSPSHVDMARKRSR